MEPINKNREVMIHKIIPEMDFNLKAYKNHVLKAIECYPDSLVYEEVSELFEALYPEVLKSIAPLIVWMAEPNDKANRIPELIDCDELIYATVTLGKEIVLKINEYFEKDELIEAVLLDAMATGLLFKLNETLYKHIYDYVFHQEKGIIALSPGERGTPIEYQRIIEEKLGKANGIRVTEGYLLEPIKSTSSVYGVRKGLALPKHLHNCKKCKDTTCKWRLAPYED